MMSVARPYQPRGGHLRRDSKSLYGTNSHVTATAAADTYNISYDIHGCNTKLFTGDSCIDFSQNYMPHGPNHEPLLPEYIHSSKRRKLSALSSESTGRPYQHQSIYRTDPLNHADQWERPRIYNAYCDTRLECANSAVVAATICHDASAYTSTTSKRDRSKFEDEEVVFMTRDEIDRCSPSRKDGIDQLLEATLRYTYCAFLQNLGARLDLPQSTIGTAMVLCHRFFLRRSHASHDRFLIATATLFLASKSEETPRPLNDVLRASCEISHKQNFMLLSFMYPIDWFEQYRERISEAEQLILTTLNFELNVQHPYESLTSTLQKLGFSQSVLVNLALSLVSEGLRSLLWLQFKPHQIAAGAAYLAAKFLNMNFASCHDVWHEFHTPPSVLKDVAHQLMELL